MAVQGIGPKEFEFQAFEAMNAKKQEETQKQNDAMGIAPKLEAPEKKEDDSKEIFRLAVEKEQGKGINLSMLG